MEITINTKGDWQIYWGAMPLPHGMKAVGTITRGIGDTGALLVATDGRYYQGNAGSVRSVPPVGLQYQCTCTRCGYSWSPRTDTKPKWCPHCNSPYWDKPRQSK